jgi:hypothetical protein
MKSKSAIFEDAELEAIAKREEGKLSDPTGAFARARRKLLEINTYMNPKGKRLLKKLLEQKRKCNTIPEPTVPMEEQSLEQFKQEVGF